MAKRIEITDQLAALRAVFEYAPDGLSIEEVEQRGGLGLNRRILLRRIRQLLDADEIQQSGRGRAIRYLLLAAASTATETDSSRGREASLSQGLRPSLTVTSEGRKIFDVAMRPTIQRFPVSYKREFIDAYVPNKTYYIPENIRHQLREMDQSDMTNEAAGT